MQPCAESDECADVKRNASGDRQIVGALLLIPSDSGVLIAHRVAPKSDAVRIGSEPLNGVCETGFRRIAFGTGTGGRARSPAIKKRGKPIARRRKTSRVRLRSG